MSAPNPFSIAIGGLRPGAPSLEIGTQGFLVSITPSPTPEEEGEDTYFVPLRWSSPRSRQDCRIEVQGCRATLTATDANVAAAMPSTAELDEMMEAAEAELILAELEAEEELHKQRQYLTKWNQTIPRWKAHQAKKARRKAFQQSVRHLADQIGEGPQAVEDLCAVVVGLLEQQRNLRAMVEGLVEETKPATKKSRKK